MGQYLTRDQTIHIQKGREWGDDKHGYNTARDRTGKNS